MKHCFLAMSINILNIILIVVLRYSQISVPIFRRRKLCLHYHHRLKVARYPKRGQVKFNLFSFGITLALLPKVDRKETQLKAKTVIR